MNNLIDFEAEICNDIDKGDIINYSWDFDFTDGIQKQKFGREVNYTYKLAGIYKITLTIADGIVEKSTFTTINITKSSSDGPTDSGDDKESEINNYIWLVALVIIIIVLLFFTLNYKQIF